MTHFDLYQFHEVGRSDWTYETLKPPLSLSEILTDIKFHWCLYNNLIKSIRKRISFLILRVFQRISYNIGWIISRKKILKDKEGIL